MSQSLIEALQDSTCYPHPVSHVSLRETHISWVLLAGDHAYKIKKPLDFGFLDFSTLEKRRHFCEEEIRLNSRLASDIYLDAVPITGSPDAPIINGEGEPFEYAVHMRVFDNEGLFSTLQARGELTEAHMDDMVDQLVDFHQRAEQAAPDSAFGTPEAVHAPTRQNFEQLRELLEDSTDLARLRRLEQWADESYERLAPLMTERLRQGFVRETHGDMHLGNVVQSDGRVLIFDCIEFNDDLRWNDVCCELAFLLMDLEVRGEWALSRHVLDRYLERSGDYELVRLLPYYKAYRAMVRAKIAMFRVNQPGLEEAEKRDIHAEYRRYAELAERYTELEIPWLLVSVGVSGSGKSRFTQQVVRELGSIRIRSDIERKRLYGLTPDADSDSAIDSGIYTAEATERTYQRLGELAGMLLDAGFPVCIDATALRRVQRDRLRHEAEKRGLQVLTISFEADEATLKRRIEKRQQQRGEVSEAGIEVLGHQLATREPFGDDEKGQVVHLDTTAEGASHRLVELLRDRLHLS
ncbi:AAA family ATPase [Kushneria phosphatilytica]|uniref:AAA family ATPase n=1 Tax=Kushneria phosphatilytica TaxID=657387 RepID=A0A1S1NVI6_9GAMM|nr:bifunctional aminoglycoside phosphotransferase/ATP-binding protein [Kushneria phosphatilytica]OHV08896.1 hypothetical protein BH688_12895 [Kushneria phosphatilytica]QEL12617.1 AAA family ATPase [Kushneria phosphatilytica]